MGKFYKSPLNWYGGKYYQAKDIIKIFPEHRTYCEVFGGAGHVLFRKEPSQIDVYNDIHSGLYLFFKLLRDACMRDKLLTQIQLTPYSREEFNNSKDWMYEEDEIEKVRKFYVRTMQSVGGIGGWSRAKTNSRRGMSQAVSRWLGNVDENMVDLIERLREIQIENLDFRVCIKKYDSKSTLFYLDPPYIHETRSLKKGYKHEMNDTDHKDLVNILKGIEGRAVLSGYDHPIYIELEKVGWEKVYLGEYSKRSNLSNDGQLKKGKEFLWINFK